MQRESTEREPSARESRPERRPPREESRRPRREPERSSDFADDESRIEVSRTEFLGESDDIEGVSAGAAGEGEATGEDAASREEGERTGRKRRRRRRGGRRSRRDRPDGERDAVDSEDHAAESAGGVVSDSEDIEFLDLSAGGETSAEGTEEDAEETSGTPGDEEPRQRKGRRRRRRRGSGRGREKERAAGEPEGSAPKGTSSDELADDRNVDAQADADDALGDEDSEDDDIDSVGMGEALSDDEGDGDSDSAIDKNSHRAIPAWEEAIGYIVSVNMESRAKNPKASVPRGRGRGRGGRGGARGGAPRRS